MSVAVHQPVSTAEIQLAMHHYCTNLCWQPLTFVTNTQVTYAGIAYQRDLEDIGITIKVMITVTTTITYLARQDCSMCCSLAVPHAPVVPVKQLGGCGDRQAQAVAMQCHLHICITAEVTGGGLHPFWQASIGGQQG